MEKVKLNELADIYLGVTHTPEYVFEGVPFLSVKDISGGKICFDDCKYISQEEFDSLSEGAKPKAGDMLFCRVGTLGKPIIIPEGTPLFGSFVSLGYLRNKDNNRCDLNYLRYWMYSSSFWKQVNSNVKGASQVNLNTGWLSKFDIDLPDMEEQLYRISILDKCKSVIEQREEELKILDDLIKARFVELFGDIKEEQFLGEISELVTVGIANSATHAYAESGVPMLRNQNIRENYLDDSDLIYIKPEFAAKYESKKLKENDIIAMRTGYPGVACLVPKKYEGCQTFTTLIVRLKEGNNPSYVCSYINSDFGKAFIDSEKVGVAQQNVGAKSLAQMPIKMAPKELQDEFESFIKQVDKSKFVRMNVNIAC